MVTIVKFYININILPSSSFKSPDHHCNDYDDHGHEHDNDHDYDDDEDDDGGEDDDLVTITNVSSCLSKTSSLNSFQEIQLMLFEMFPTAF